VRVGKRFEILGRLGGGGMGQVYKARDRELDELIALKVLTDELDGDIAQLERLKREVRVARRIASPHVCRIHDMVEFADGRKGIAMQLIEGKTLFKRLREGAGGDWKKVALWASQIATGLGAAHALGIVHRDLKPENVMIDAQDQAVVLDFGVAFQTEKKGAPVEERLTADGIILGTLLYMAPEQLTAAPLDGRADLYALGLLIAEALSGNVPFSGRSYEEILRERVIQPRPYRLREHVPAAPPALDAVVGRLLAFKREDRPDSAFELADKLREIAVGEVYDAPAGPDTAPASDAMLPPTARTRVGPALGVVGAILGAVVAAALMLDRTATNATPAAPHADRAGLGRATGYPAGRRRARHATRRAAGSERRARRPRDTRCRRHDHGHCGGPRRTNRTERFADAERDQPNASASERAARARRALI
jgi:serine/threonine protein kinase